VTRAAVMMALCSRTHAEFIAAALMRGGFVGEYIHNMQMSGCTVCTQTQETFGRLVCWTPVSCLQSCNCKPSTRPSRYVHISACSTVFMYVNIHF
jgi:hypothetical protein